MAKGSTVWGILDQVSMSSGSALRVAGLGAASGLYLDSSTPISVNVQTAGSTALDSTNKLPVSLYGKVTNAGDTAIKSAAGGALTVALVFGSGNDVIGTQLGGADGQTNSFYALLCGTRPSLFNGVTWDSVRGNVEETILAAAARTANTTSADNTCHNSERLLLFVNVAALTSTPTISPTLQIKHSISSNYLTVWTAASAIAASGTYAYYFADGAASNGGAFTQVLSFGLPARTWRVNMNHSSASTITYSVSAAKLL